MLYSSTLIKRSIKAAVEATYGSKYDGWYCPTLLIPIGLCTMDAPLIGNIKPTPGLSIPDKVMGFLILTPI